MIVGVDPKAKLGLPAADIGGRVFKTWDMLSDGIGTKAQTFVRARPDLFPGIELQPVRYLQPDGTEAGTGVMRWTFGAKADKALANYEVQRRGAPGKDGRVDVVVDRRSGAIVYAGKPYSYDPAGTELKDAATFIGGALAGYAAVTALAGATAGAGVGASAGAGAEGIGGQSFVDAAIAQGSASIEASVAADLAAGAGIDAASLSAIEAAALSPLSVGTVAAVGVGSAAGAAAGSSSSSWLSSFGSKLADVGVNSATKAGSNWLTSALTAALVGGSASGNDQAGGGVAVERAAASDGQGAASSFGPWLMVLALAAGAVALA